MPTLPDPRNIARQTRKSGKTFDAGDSQTVSQPHHLLGAARQNSFKTPLPGRVRHIATRKKKEAGMLLKLSHDHNICGVGVARHSEDRTAIFSDAGDSQTVSQPHHLPGMARQNSFKTPLPGRVRHIATRKKKEAGMLLKLSHDHNICGVGVARHSEDRTAIFSDAGESQTVSQPHHLPGAARQNSFKTPLPGRARHIETRKKKEAGMILKLSHRLIPSHAWGPPFKRVLMPSHPVIPYAHLAEGLRNGR